MMRHLGLKIKTSQMTGKEKRMRFSVKLKYM